MSEPAHGPWRLHLVDDTTIVDANGRFVASVCGGDEDLGDQDYNNPDEWPVLEANARLIAAAPDILDALKDAQKRLRGAGMLGGADDPVNAAIARAEGGS